MKVTRLEVASPAPQPRIIAALEHLLADARSGEIQAIAYAAVNTQGQVATGFDTGGARLSELHFAAADLTRRILEHGTR